MLRSLALAALMGASSVLAVKCSVDSKCPKDTPCCSTYGECGVGAYCLGGCDPKMSFSLDACVPAPVCEDRVMKLDNLDRVADISEYLGDASKADWMSSGEPTIYKDNLLLTMPKDSVGTVLSSTVYMWYGNVKARLKTSRGAGVVTAFILFSDVKDEIDFEWIGVDLETTQTNYYFQGITDYHNSGNISTTDTFDNFHEYEIRWTPEKIEWYVDGKLGRTKLKKDSYNETSKNYDYPQTPSRVQLSLWPGGLASNAKGTIDWAGGEIDWNHPDVQNGGYFYATFSDVEIQCYNADSGEGTNKGTSYTYDDVAGLSGNIVDGNKSTKIASLKATGLDPEKGKVTKPKDTSKDDSKDSSKDDSKDSSKDDSKDSKDDKSSKDSSDDEPESASIPGGSNVPGNSADSGKTSSSDSSSSSDSGSSVPGDVGNTEQADTTNCKTDSFNQDCSTKSASKDSSSSDSGNGSSGSTRTSASALAIIIAGCALYWL